MDMGRSPCIGVVLPRIRARSNGQEPVTPVFIRQTAAHTEEVGIERPRPLISLMQVAAGGVGLPDLQQGVRNRLSTFVEYAASHDDTLTNGLAPGTGIACEIGIRRGNRADSWPRPRQLRNGERHIDERKRWCAAARRLIGL